MLSSLATGKTPKPESQMKRLNLMALIVIACALSPVALAQTQQPLVFTEHSSSLLTVTLDGNPYGEVNSIVPNNWLWIPPVVFTSLEVPNQNTYWREPENPNHGNWFWAIDTGFLALSDGDFTGLGFPSVPDGAVQARYLKVVAATGAETWWDVQFIDLGDGTSVPDGGTTALLLGLGCTLLGLYRNRRS